MPKRTRVLISACLLGQNVRYDGQAKMLPGDPLPHLERLAELIPFCPELAGGLPVPRSPAEIEPGFCGDDVLAGRARVLDLSGEDVTAAFAEGAQKDRDLRPCAELHPCAADRGQPLLRVAGSL